MARRIPREFVPLDLNMPRDPDIRRAGPTAEGPKGEPPPTLTTVTVDGEVYTLTSRQRKTLRRLGRGQTINRSMYGDPITGRCIMGEMPERPADEDLNVVTWCDWESRVYGWYRNPRLSPFGEKLLAALLEAEPPTAKGGSER